MDLESNTCTVSTSSEEELLYFCSKLKSSVIKSSIVCKTIKQIDAKAKGWFLKERAWMRNGSTISQKAHDLSHCKIICKNCTAFSWNSDTQTCNITHDENLTEICQMLRPSSELLCGDQKDSPSIVLNNRNCKELYTADQCKDSRNYLMRFSNSSEHQCAEIYGGECEFYKWKVPIASCDYEIEDGTYYNIVCRYPIPHKKRIACCSLHLTAHPKLGSQLQIPFDWGPGCGNLTDYSLLFENYIKISSLVEPTTSECSLKMSLFENEDFAEFYLRAEDLRPINSNKSIGRFQRWRSEEFRIYYPNCVNPKTDMKNEGELK